MSVKRDKYEISLWEDVLVAASGDVPEHYKEKKIAVIGSDNMTAQFRAVEPKLVENINGTNTLTFKMFYTYIDNETGESKSNPFLSLLVNERKVKVLWKNKWYDLVIKTCQEDSSGKSITYTCKDLYINELSKTGFNLEFNTELKNNQGTVQELAEAVLDGSDWQLAYNSSDPTQIIKQKREESVYELTGAEIVSNFTAYDENNTAVSVTSANKILVYYSVIQNQEKYCQFLFKQDNNFQKEKGSQLVVDGKCLYINLTAWDSTTQPGYLLGKNGSTTIFKISTSKTVSNNYRAERLIRTQKQTLDPLTGKYVYNYTYTGGLLAYGYKETVYNDPTFVNNLLVNYKDFGSTEGWSGGTLYHVLYPTFTGDNVANYSAKSYLKFTAGNYLNSGIKQSASFIPDGFQANEKYIFRFKAMSDSGDKPSGTYITSGFTPKVCAYTLSGTTYTFGTNYFTVSPASSGGDNWVEFTLTCSKSVTKKTLLSSDIGLFLVSDGTYWLEQVEFFPLIMGKNGTGDTVRINPGEMEKQSLAQTAYKYYLANQAVISAEDLEYLYVGYEDWSSAPLTPIFNGNFEKIRSITAKNSNRFNLLQTLAETFECWAKFTIEHNEETGEVLYDSTGRPKKWVSFHTEIGSRNNIGFIYGIDLKTISRTINSDQITSKIIVLPNKNEFGKDGFCTIARSKENYAKDTFILNFDYYVSQGLLDLGSLNKDLYQSTDAIGYYYWLNKYNTEYDTITEEISKKKIELTKQESLLKVYSQYLTSIAEEITSIESEIMSLAGVTSMSAATTYIKKNPDNTKVVSLMNQWTNLKNSLAQYTTQRTKLNQSITNLKTYLTEKEDRQEELIELIKGKHQEFYNKYSRFIQEGSWISEEYLDDDLYYLDAQSVLYTSSRPQVSYNVSVLRLSALEEFKNKIFKLGDITYIQDTEFFGYTWINGIKTPYKEEVLVSEITSNFDSPENDSFQVQNYKTQFEDLFQRITATTQSLQYASGEYQRAANAFTETGAINPLTLQNSFLLNQDLVFSAQNDSVIYDSTGITVTDTSNPNKKVKVTSGGIFISTDGGASWKSAVRGDGISTQYLTAGYINTNNISIMDGNNTSFRWDADGINAYWNNSEVGTILNKFVRFDQYGIYGINNWTVSQTDSGATYNPNVEEGGLSGEEKIWRDAQFGMTWKGFFIRNKYGPGYVEISSEKDIVVNDGTYDRIKIGNLSTMENPIYGIRIKDGLNTVVMETIDDGTLWLKERLNISTTDAQSVGIGYLTAVKPNTSIHEVINANNAFIVYEDGSIKGTNVNFTGGTIGGLSIEELGANIKQAQITSNNGNMFNGESPESITLTANLQGKGTNPLTYVWKKDGVLIPDATSDSLVVYNGDIANNNRATYSVVITEDGVPYTNIITIQKVTSEATFYTINSTQPQILRTLSNSVVVFSPDLFNMSFYYGSTQISYLNRDFKFFIDNIEITEDFTNVIQWLETTDGSGIYYAQLNLQALMDLQLVKYIEFTDTYFEEDKTYYEFDDTLQQYIVTLDTVKVEGKTYYIEDITIEDLKDSLASKDFLEFKIILSQAGEPVQTFVYPILFATTFELANFSITSAGIAAAVNASTLTFNSNGLTILDNGFRITRSYIENDETKTEILLEYDPNKGESLSIKGSGVFSGELQAASGTFTGTLQAASGSFSGEIIATQGQIADLIIGIIYDEFTGTSFEPDTVYYEYDSINEEYFETVDTTKQEEKTYYVADGVLKDVSENLIIKGSTGQIITNNIVLKQGATIDTYLLLGNAKLYNPEKNSNRYFIEITKDLATVVSLTDSGILQLGNIILNGDTSMAYFGGTSGINIDGTTGIINGFNNAWSITPSAATFNKISISQGIFEAGYTQTLGGSMIFRYGTNCTKLTNPKEAQLAVKDASKFKINDWVILSQTINDANIVYVKIAAVDEITGIITFTEDININYDTITLICKENEFGELTDNLYFGINSQEAQSGWLLPRALTMREIVLGVNGLEEGNINLVLGDLSSISLASGEGLEPIKLTGFGLYGNNVYLNGSLTTQVGTNSYAGVNTLSGAQATKFGTTDTSKIVFWAGSDNVTNTSIQQAAFQVTENGSIYASQGLFEGAIITQSIIQGARIYTSSLYGGTEGQEAALKIYDTTKGIQFFEARDSVNPMLQISNNGFIVNDYLFFEFGETSSINNDILARINTIETNYINFSNLRIEDSSVYYLDFSGETPLEKGRVLFSNTITEFKFSNNTIFSFDNDSLDIKKELRAEANVILANGNSKMEYKKEVGGYNLYVTDLFSN